MEKFIKKKRVLVFGPDVLSPYELKKYRELIKEYGVDENTFITNAVRHLLYELLE